MYQSIGGELDLIEVRHHVTKDGSPVVAVTGYVTNYPLTSMVLSPDEAFKLAADLTGAAHELVLQQQAAA